MKIIIAGSQNTDKHAIARELQSINDDLTIAPIFNTRMEFKGKTSEFYYYMPTEEVELSYKNNAFMWIRTSDNESCGVTMPDMYSSNIFVMSFADFNNMSNPVFNEFIMDGLIVFLDTKNGNSQDDINESKFACERIFSSPYLYFLDEDTDYIVNTIINYINGDEKERREISEALNN